MNEMLALPPRREAPSRAETMLADIAACRTILRARNALTALLADTSTLAALGTGPQDAWWHIWRAAEIGLDEALLDFGGDEIAAAEQAEGGR